MVVDPHQFGEDRAEIRATRRERHAEQLLDGVVPGDLIGDRRDVIHPVDDRHVLIEIEVLAQLLETAVQVADVGDRIDDRFAVERQHEPQRRVRRRMLRTEIEGPQIFLFRRLGVTQIGKLQRHVCLETSSRMTTVGVIRSSTLGSRDHGEVMPFTAASQGIVLAQRKRGELLRHEDAFQVRMAGEADAEHVEHFPLQPIGPLPERNRRRESRIGVVDVRADIDPLTARRVDEHVQHAESVPRVGVFEQVGRRQFGEQIETAFALEEGERLENRCGGNVEANVITEAARLDVGRSETFFQSLFCGAH